MQTADEWTQAVDRQMAKVVVNDLMDEIMEENRRLSGQLAVANKRLQLLDKYRTSLALIVRECECGRAQQKRHEFDRLESEYRSVVDTSQESGSQTGEELAVETDADRTSVKPIVVNGFSKAAKSKLNLTFVKTNTSGFAKDGHSLKHFNIFNTAKDSKDGLIDSKDIISKVEHKFGINNLNDISGESKVDIRSVGYKIKNRKIKDKPKVNNTNSNANRIKRKYTKRQPLVHNPYQNFYDKTETGFRCTYTENCCYENDRLERVKAHINKCHTNERPFVCGQCGQRFTRSDYVSEHTNRVHSTVRYTCDAVDCKYETISYKALVYHRLRHTGVKPFVCDQTDCGRSFYRRADLRNHHMRVHSELRPFPCDWPGCDSAFKTSDAAKDHLRTHTGEKPFPCDWPGCEWRFSLKSQLNKHGLIHRQIKNFVCNWPECGKRFRRGWNLKVHFQVHSGEKPYNCADPNCDKRFTEKRNMLKHFHTHHQMN